jgi:hypothetical protein
MLLVYKSKRSYAFRMPASSTKYLPLLTVSLPDVTQPRLTRSASKHSSSPPQQSPQRLRDNLRNEVQVGWKGLLLRRQQCLRENPLYIQDQPREAQQANNTPQYFPFSNTQADTELGLTAAKKAGLDVFRTWGFNDKNATYNPAGLPQYGGEGAGATEVVFQRWGADGKSTIDVAGFDKVVNAATKVGVKLIVALTNNWADYGGMDVYTVNLGGKYHDDVRVPCLAKLRTIASSATVC